MAYTPEQLAELRRLRALIDAPAPDKVRVTQTDVAKRPPHVGKKTSVRKTNTHDRCAVKVTYPTGGSVEFSVNRGSERVAVAGSSDPKVAREQLAAANRLCKHRPGETNGQRVDRVADVCARYSGVAALVEALLAAERLLKD